MTRLTALALIVLTAELAAWTACVWTAQDKSITAAHHALHGGR